MRAFAAGIEIDRPEAVAKIIATSNTTIAEMPQLKFPACPFSGEEDALHMVYAPLASYLRGGPRLGGGGGGGGLL